MVINLPQREEFVRRKRKRRIIKASIIFSVFVFFIALSSFIAHRPSLRISKVELTGGVLVTEKEVQSKTLEYLSGSYFWLYPKNNAFFYPRKALKQYLSDSFKRIDTIDLNLKNFKVLTVKITERKPVAVWCEKKDETEDCYFIDQNSTIFAEAPIFSGDAYFKYYGPVQGDSLIGSEYIASTTVFGEINKFVESIKKLALHPQYVVAKGKDEFSLIIAGGGEILFDTKRPLTTASENLEVLISTPPLSKGLNNLDYIDLRYGNKLFYKLKE